jgi:phosphate transport system permease protein
MVMVCGLALTLAPLAWVLVYVASQGLKYLGPEFLSQNPPGNPSLAGGGFYNGIVGTFEIVGIAFLIAAPVGIFAAVYLVEFEGRFAALVRFLTDVLVGIPSIVTGAFVYAAWVIRFGFSGLAGSLALAIVMLPLVVRSTEEMLRLVPDHLREAAYALGAPRWRTIVRVVLPTAWAGIVTGLMLAVARAAGETAPLLLTALGNDLFTEYRPTARMSTLSLQIFGNAITGFRAAQARAWAGALTLILIVLIFSVVARFFGTRRERMLYAR